MSTIRIMFIVIGVLTGTSHAHAAWSGQLPIDGLKVQENGAWVRLQGFANSDASITCGSSEFWMASTSTGYKERLAMLMAARLGGTSVKLSYYSCNANGYLDLGSVMSVD